MSEPHLGISWQLGMPSAATASKITSWKKRAQVLSQVSSAMQYVPGGLPGGLPSFSDSGHISPRQAFKPHGALSDSYHRDLSELNAN